MLPAAAASVSSEEARHGLCNRGMPGAPVASSSCPVEPPPSSEDGRVLRGENVDTQFTCGRMDLLDQGAPGSCQEDGQQLLKACVKELDEVPEVSLFHIPGLGNVLCSLLTLTKKWLLLMC